MGRKGFIKLLGILIASIFSVKIKKEQNEIFLPIVHNQNSKDNDQMTDWYVAHDGGTGLAAGTIDDPKGLEHFRETTKLVLPGDTVHFRGGIYELINPVNAVKWAGTAESPITIKPYNFETVIIDGAILVSGEYQEWNNFRMLSTAWLTRDSAESGGSPSDIGDVHEGFDFNVDNCKILNCVIHDCRQGIKAIRDDGITFEGCVFFNNGWKGTDRGHGHGIYWNGDGATIEGNVFAQGFSSWGHHVYGESGQTIDNLISRNNVSIDQTYLARSTSKMSNINVEDNEQWHENMDVGWTNFANIGLSLQNNYLAKAFLRVRKWASATVTGNFVARERALLNFWSASDQDIIWDKNEYHHVIDDPGRFMLDDGLETSYADWRAKYGFDRASSFDNSFPIVNRTRVISAGDHWIVVVYNWEGLKNVKINLSGLGLKIGSVYRLRQVQDYFGDCVEFTHQDNLVEISMVDHSVAIPYGADAPLKASTFPDFGCFIIEDTGLKTPPKPPKKGNDLNKDRRKFSDRQYDQKIQIEQADQ